MFMSDYDVPPMSRAVPAREPALRTQALGKAIRRLRRHPDLTLEDLALSAGISRSFLSQIERAHACLVERGHVRAPCASDSATAASMCLSDPAEHPDVEAFITKLPAGGTYPTWHQEPVSG